MKNLLIALIAIFTITLVSCSEQEGQAPLEEAQKVEISEVSYQISLEEKNILDSLKRAEEEEMFWKEVIAEISSASDDSVMYSYLWNSRELCQSPLNLDSLLVTDKSLFLRDVGCSDETDDSGFEVWSSCSSKKVSVLYHHDGSSDLILSEREVSIPHYLAGERSYKEVSRHSLTERSFMDAVNTISCKDKLPGSSSKIEPQVMLSRFKALDSIVADFGKIDSLFIQGSAPLHGSISENLYGYRLKQSHSFEVRGYGFADYDHSMTFGITTSSIILDGVIYPKGSFCIFNFDLGYDNYTAGYDSRDETNQVYLFEEEELFLRDLRKSMNVCGDRDNSIHLLLYPRAIAYWGSNQIL